MSTAQRRDSHDDMHKAAVLQVEDASSAFDEKLEQEHRGDYSGAVGKTDEREIALVRKLDMRIMPALFVLYFLNKLDQNALANARLDSLEKHLGLKGTEYNTCISILYVGYLFMQVPSNMLLASKKVRPSLYMASAAALWGVVAALTALAKNYTGLLLIRFFLGVVEAPFYPGALYMLSIFYTRKEIATRVSILYAGNIVATSFAGLIAAATFTTLGGKGGLYGWQYLFIIEGALTVGCAFIAAFMFPDYPLTTRWLSQEERELAHDRILRDTVGGAESQGPMKGLSQALRDPRLYLFAIMQNMHLNATSFNQFFPTVVSSLGFNKTITLLLTAPPSLVAGIVGVCVGLSSGRFNERTYHIATMMGIAIIGFVISCLTFNTAARYTACFMFASGVYSVNSVILGWLSATLGSTPEKKAASLSLVNLVSMASFIYTPYLYNAKDAPKYVTAMSANACFSFVSICCAFGMKFWLKRTNKKMKEENPENSVVYAY